MCYNRVTKKGAAALKKLLEKFCTRKLEMRSNLAQNSRQRPDPQEVMIRD
jgi:hypothetical protein